MKALGTIFSIVGVISILAAIVGLIDAFSGSYDVAASVGHSRVLAHGLDKVMESSVRVHARSEAVPPGVNTQDPALAKKAVGDYNEMCRVCHGAPGMQPDDWTKGLYPHAPNLTNKRAEEGWSAAEVHWIIEHGIKDSGMSAFGKTHDPDELWALTALVRQFLTMPPAQYHQWTEEAPKEEPEASEPGKTRT